MKHCILLNMHKYLYYKIILNDQQSWRNNIKYINYLFTKMIQNKVYNIKKKISRLVFTIFDRNPVK